MQDNRKVKLVKPVENPVPNVLTRIKKRKKVTKFFFNTPVKEHINVEMTAVFVQPYS